MKCKGCEKCTHEKSIDELMTDLKGEPVARTDTRLGDYHHVVVVGRTYLFCDKAQAGKAFKLAVGKSKYGAAFMPPLKNLPQITFCPPMAEETKATV